MRPDQFDDPAGTKTIRERAAQMVRILVAFSIKQYAEPTVTYTVPGEPHAP